MSSYKRMNINMNGIHVSISEDVYLLKDVTIENRRYFHKYPEASLKEYSTAEYIRNFLDENGIEYIKVGETGTLAIIKGEKVSDLNKTIFLRGDIDATEIDDRKTVSYASKNPGVCHASGHDAQAAALLSAAVVLNSRRNQFSGTVKIAFQQAEEIAEGAVKFLSEGLLDDVNFAFALHIASYLPVGKIGVTPGPQSASCDIFKIKINGEGAHVSTPEKGRDALLATANTVMQLSLIHI